MGKNQTETQGWVIISGGDFICEFTFSRLRSEAINKWVTLWTKPSTWSGHKKRGVKCVKATKTISINTTK